MDHVIYVANISPMLLGPITHVDFFQEMGTLANLRVKNPSLH